MEFVESLPREETDVEKSKEWSAREESSVAAKGLKWVSFESTPREESDEKSSQETSVREESEAAEGLKLVSFVLFGRQRLYTKGAIDNAHLISTIYPGFKGRFYIADDVPKEVVAEIAATNADVVMFSRADYPGRTSHCLRFIPCDEPGVSVVLVRDADSRINTREAAATAEWLSLGARYHVMHERVHDAKYGEVMGGMWGCRSLDGSTPCPGLADAARRFMAEDSCRDKYGSDMQLLSIFLAPQLTADNCVHHVDGVMERSLGSLCVPRKPFPETSFRGFVGQPVNCLCPFTSFSGSGCDHINRQIPGHLASLISGNQGIMASIGQFLA